MKISPDTRVRDVLEQHPATAGIFVQEGSFYRNVQGSLYAVYDNDLTLGGFAKKNGVDVDRLLQEVNATAEADQFGPRPSGTDEEKAMERVDETAGGHDAAHDVGYTGGYRDPANIEARPVVTVQAAHGPE